MYRIGAQVAHAGKFQLGPCGGIHANCGAQPLFSSGRLYAGGFAGEANAERNLKGVLGAMY